MLRRDREDLVETEAIKLSGLRLKPLGVRLVGCDQHALARRAQQVGQLFIERRHPFPHVNDPDERGRIFNRRRRLFQYVGRYHGIVVRHYAARVHEREAATVPLRLSVYAVARNPRLVSDNRAPLAREAIKECGLPDIGPTDDGHQRQGAAHLIHARATITLASLRFPYLFCLIRALGHQSSSRCEIFCREQDKEGSGKNSPCSLPVECSARCEQPARMKPRKALLHSLAAAGKPPEPLLTTTVKPVNAFKRLLCPTPKWLIFHGCQPF